MLSLGTSPIDTADRVAHMTMLSAVICVMNVGNHLSQTLVHFVTARASLITDPSNIRSTNSCQVQTFQDNLCTYF